MFGALSFIGARRSLSLPPDDASRDILSAGWFSDAVAISTLKPDAGDFGEPSNATRQRRALPGINAFNLNDPQFPKNFGTYLRHLMRTDKVAFLWPNTKLHGCRATALETM
jgi:hypothetical protein